MNASRRNALIVGAGLAAAAAGYGAHRWLRLGGAVKPGGIDQLLALNLPDAEGRPQPVTQWRGKLLLANFWATWCEPCREEVPALIRSQQIHRDKNLQIVGISIDSADKVSQFSKTYGITYPLLIGGLESIELVRALGNRSGGLPFTVLVSPQGRLLASHLGGLTDRTLAEFLAPHLQGIASSAEKLP